MFIVNSKMDEPTERQKLSTPSDTLYARGCSAHNKSHNTTLINADTFLVISQDVAKMLRQCH